MMTIDLYSFQTTDIDEVRALVEDRFHIKFVPHDSYHYGNYYRYKESDPDEERFFMLRQNIVFEGELHYPELLEKAVLLSAGSAKGGNELRSWLESLGAKRVERELGA